MVTKCDSPTQSRNHKPSALHTDRSTGATAHYLPNEGTTVFPKRQNLRPRKYAAPQTRETSISAMS